MPDDDPFEWEVRDASTPLMLHAVAGSCAGVSEHVAMYPLDTIKTTMQASSVKQSVGETFQTLLREQGVLRLMRGSTAIGMGCVPAHVAFFGVYEVSTSVLVDKHIDADHQPFRTAMCGGAAALSHDLILTPHDVVKQRLQLGRYGGIRDSVRQIWASEGLTGFYRSLPVTLAMNIPYTGILTATNESLKKFCCASQVTESFGMADMSRYFMLAGISGAIAAAATLPLDVLKTQIQTQGPRSTSTSLISTSANIQAIDRRIGGIVSVSVNIFRQDGIRGFFRGLVPRVALAAPSAAICWGTYESIRTGLMQSNLVS